MIKVVNPLKEQWAKSQIGKEINGFGIVGIDHYGSKGRGVWFKLESGHKAYRQFPSELSIVETEDPTQLQTNAHQHGPSCAETPVDHRCGDTEMDQGVTWAESSRNQSAKLQAIAFLHQNTETIGGIVTGYCSECNWQWPCPTYHIAAGWGIESYHECEETGWCSHVKVPMERVAKHG